MRTYIKKIKISDMVLALAIRTVIEEDYHTC